MQSKSPKVTLVFPSVNNKCSNHVSYLVSILKTLSFRTDLTEGKRKERDMILRGTQLSEVK